MKRLRGCIAALVVLAIVAVGAAAAAARTHPGSAVTGPALNVPRIRPSADASTGPGAGTTGLESLPIRAGGRRRAYLLYVPPGDSPSHRLPLVLAYHGAEGDAQSVVAATAILRSDERRHDQILVFPQGYRESWNDDAGDPPAEAADVNDIAFTQAMLRQVESNHYVDMHDVVATGISNGAILDELLGCRIAADLTAIVPVEGQIATSFTNSCSPRLPISVYEIHATADPSIPYGGGTFSGDGGPVAVLSAPASARRWAKLDGCAATPAKPVNSARGGGSVLTEYHGCDRGVRVTLETIHGGGHQWPADFTSTLADALASTPNDREAVKP